MALINTSVPNLIQGVSQQPDATRFDGQCEEQVNALSSVAEGLKKRPNTRHIARLLDAAIDENSFVHFINRDDNEKYVVIHDGSCLKAWNIITGNEATINGSTGGYIPDSGSYLDTTNARGDIKGLTVADNTFLLNTKKVVTEDATLTPPLEKSGFVYIAQGDYKKLYTVKVAGNVAETDASKALFNVTYALSWSGVAYNEGWFTISSISVAHAGSGYPANTPTTLDYRINFGTLGQVQGSYADTFRDIDISATFVDDGTGQGTKKVGSVTINGTTGQGAWGYHEAAAPSTMEAYDASVEFVVEGDDFSVPVSSVYSVESKSDTDASQASTTRIAAALFSNNAAWQADYYRTSMAESALFTAGSNGEAPEFNGVLEGNTIIISREEDKPDFTLITSDGLADQGIRAIYKKIDSLSKLPLRAPNNFKVEIVGDAEYNQDNYWVKFQTSGGDNFGDGTWIETVSPLVSVGINPSSMPITLVSTAIDTLEIRETSYSPRAVGDSSTNPHPSFVNETINDIVFFKNRLGFISDDSVVFSEAGHFFNFYRTTVSSLLDSGPIDIAVSSTKVAKLKSATVFQENLLLFADNVQFVMKGGDLFTPKTVSVDAATSFSFDDAAIPLPLGSYVYFPFTRGSYTGLRELALSANTETYDAAEVTEHVPAYIPRNLIAMAGTTSEDMIALLSGEEYTDGTNARNELYIYNYFWNNNQKVLSAWSKFTFTGEIRGIEFIESTLYAVITNNGETNLVEMPLESGLKDNAGYVTHLDSRVSTTVDIGSSTITLPYTPEDNSVEVYTTDGLALNCTNSGSTVTLSSPVSSDTDVWVGIPYTMKYTFSEQLFKAKAGNGKSPSNAAKMLIRNGSLYYDKSAYFKVKVTPKFRDTYENIFTPDVVGSSTLGSLSLDSGFYRFPVFTKPQDTTITIENESALPSTFQSAEFESFVHSRSNRYG
jgi:hypothetical protein